MSGFPPIEELVPHRGAMLWIDRVVAADAAGLEVEVVISSSGLYADEQGAMPAWLGIELMAQTLAAHVGFRARAAGLPPRPGVLLGCRTYRAAKPAFAAGSVLRVRARESFSDESGFAAYDCAIAGQAGELASAQLKVFEPADFAAFVATLENG
jgi:predicted hotdog family 3-hydroxylacyl-ACP dehydratase